MKSRKGSAVKKGLKFFIYGEQGTWKSSKALELMEMTNEEGRPLRVAYIDTEYGSVDNYLEDLQTKGIDLDNLYMVYTNEYNEVESILEKLINNEELYIEDDEGNEEQVFDADGNPFVADAIVLDSATPIQDTLKYSMILTSEERASLRAEKKEVSAKEKRVAEATAGMEFKDYDKLNHKGKNLLRSLITRTDKYVCVTARQKNKTENQKINGEFKNVVVGVQPDCFKDAQYEFFTVLRLYEDQDDMTIKAQVERKDRTGRFAQGEIIEEPSLLYWQDVINKNANREKAVVMSKSFDETVREEQKALYNTQNTSKKTDSNTSSDEIKEVDLNNPSMIVAEITRIRGGLSPAKKKALVANFKKSENDLPSKPTDDVELEKLKEMLEIAQSM